MDKRLSPHFLAAEFTCNHCGHECPGGMDPKLIELLEELRAHFGKPVVISSGYRCPAHNARVGGAKHSQHMRGTAADVKVVGVAPAVVQQWANQHMSGWGGVGSYPRFTHLDVRQGPARWKQ